MTFAFEISSLSSTGRGRSRGRAESLNWTSGVCRMDNPQTREQVQQNLAKVRALDARIRNGGHFTLIVFDHFDALCIMHGSSMKELFNPPSLECTHECCPLSCGVD